MPKPIAATQEKIDELNALADRVAEGRLPIKTAHKRADEILLTFAPPCIQTAYRRGCWERL